METDEAREKGARSEEETTESKNESRKERRTDSSIGLSGFELFLNSQTPYYSLY